MTRHVDYIKGTSCRTVWQRCCMSWLPDIQYSFFEVCITSMELLSS